MTALEKEVLEMERKLIISNINRMVDHSQHNEKRPVTEQRQIVKSIILGSKKVKRINILLGYDTFFEDLLIAMNDAMWQVLNEEIKVLKQYDKNTH